MPITMFATQSARRYTVVRIVSRGGDYLISTSLITLYGDSWFFLIIAISSLFNVGVDYSGQKLWAFEQASTKRKVFFKEVLPYCILRGLLALLGFSTLILLYFYLKIPYAISALVVALALWVISFQISKVLFIGSSHGLPIYFRKAWIFTRNLVRS